MKQRRLLVAIGAGALALVAASTSIAYAAGYRINTSDSIPVGLYRKTGSADYRPGTVALYCPPDSPVFRGARDNGYIPPGFCPNGYAPLLKPVAAVAGDVVASGRAGLAVNGVPLRNTRSYRADARGHLLPRLKAGLHPVPAGKVWLISTHNPASFDSRYFGPVARSELRGELAPVWVAGDGR